MFLNDTLCMEKSIKNFEDLNEYSLNYNAQFFTDKNIAFFIRVLYHMKKNKKDKFLIFITL